MPRYSKLSQTRALCAPTAITSGPLLDFLIPPCATKAGTSHLGRRYLHSFQQDDGLETSFFSALGLAGLCRKHKSTVTRGSRAEHSQQRRSTSTTTRRVQGSSINHQRYDSKGRLIIETTAPRQPAFSYKEYQEHGFFDANEQQFAASTKLPASFFHDVNSIRQLIPLESTTGEGDGKLPEVVRQGNHTKPGCHRLSSLFVT